MKRIFAAIMMVAVTSCVVLGADAAVADAVKTNPWAPVLGDFLQMLIQILTPIFVVLASWAAWAIAKKFGIEKNAAMDEMLKGYVQEGINWADAWAKTQSQKPTGDQKKAEAIRHILGLVGASPLPQIAEDRLKIMVEAFLVAENKQSGAADPTSA